MSNKSRGNPSAPKPDVANAKIAGQGAQLYARKGNIDGGGGPPTRRTRRGKIGDPVLQAGDPYRVRERAGERYALSGMIMRCLVAPLLLAVTTPGWERRALFRIRRSRVARRRRRLGRCGRLGVGAEITPAPQRRYRRIYLGRARLPCARPSGYSRCHLATDSMEDTPFFRAPAIHPMEFWPNVPFGGKRRMAHIRRPTATR